MELKTCIPVSPKFVLEKIKFKISHYIQHDFICLHPGLSKDQISMFKSLVSNSLLNGCIGKQILQRRQILCLINGNHEKKIFSIFFDR